MLALEPLHAMAFAADKGLKHYLKTQYADQTFRGLYHWNPFDAALLVPYFLVMIVLALYGIHRYTMCYHYFKFRKRHNPDPPQLFAELPRVTVQLPIFNEQFVIDRLIEAVCAMEYPPEKLEIQVLDDSTDETTEVASAIVDRYAALGHPIVYIHRQNRHGFKAGALDAGLKVANGEFIAIFDADFVPPPDWLMRVIHHFAEPGIGMVQTRWTHLNRDYSLLTQIEAILLDGHFVLEHGARARANQFFNFNGTAGMWRRQAITDAGGWQHDTLTEDTDLSYRSQMAGWHFKYLPEIECPAELPIEMTAFKTQQARWAKGLIQTSKKVLPMMFRSDVPRRIKVEAVYHLTANLSYPLMIVMTALLIPCMIVRFYQGWFQMLLIDVPLFTASSLSIAVFYLMSQRVLFPEDLDEDVPLPSLPDGAGDRADGDQFEGGDGGAVRHQERVRPHPEVCRGQEGREVAGGQIPQAAQTGALDRTAHRLLLLPGHHLLFLKPQLLHRAVFDSVCGWVLVHGADEPAARPVRAVAWRRGQHHGRVKSQAVPGGSLIPDL